MLNAPRGIFGLFQHLSSGFRSRNKFGMTQERIVWLVGLATFFFGFGAAAILNTYLFMVRSPLVLNFRSSLNFVSSIFGDGIILPVVNMLAVSFIIKNRELMNKLILSLGFIGGIIITSYFHLVQALNGLVNWAMPEPWHWNLLGVWHAIYMFLVASFLSLYFLVLIKALISRKKVSKTALFAIGGIIIFFILLKLDYIEVNLNNLF